MSLKELNDNWEKQYIGAQFSKRLERMMLREHTEWLLRETRHRIFESVVVSVLDRHRRIRGIGLNVPNDLILNNFGTWLATMIKPVSDATKTFAINDITNVSRTMNYYGLTNAVPQTFSNKYASGAISLGTQLQVGSGTTPAARTDYNIETAFATAPESGKFSTGEGSYAAGAVTFSGAITAGGSGTVNEVGFFSVWNVAGTAYTFMLFHDILAAGVAFTAGQIINVSYSISL